MAGVGKIANPEALSTVQQLISSIVTDNFDEFGRILPTVNNVSSLFIKGMNSISFPCVDNFDHEAQTFPLTEPGPLGGPEAITCQKLIATTDELKIDKKCVQGVSYDPCDLYQSVLEWTTLIAQKASLALLQGVEADLLTNAIPLVDGANVVAPTVAGQLSEGDLICLLIALDKKNIPRADRVFLINHEEHKALMGLDCVKKADAFGSDVVARQGAIGSIHGVPVIPSQYVPAGTLYHYHKDHVRYGQQGDVLVLSGDAVKQGCKEQSWTLKYGYKVMKDGCRGASLTL